MGCCPSTANPLSSPAEVANPQQGASRAASHFPVDLPSDTNTIPQAPLPSSNGSSRPAHNSAVRAAETTAQTQTQARPLPDVHLSRPLRNHDTARVLEPPPLAIPTHSERTLVSSPSQRIAGVTAYPPAQPEIGTSSSQPHEHGRTRRAPSAYRSAPLKKSTSAQLLSQSGTPIPSSQPMARTMSASGPAPAPGSRDRPRKHPSTILGTNQAQAADGDDNRQFTSTLRTVLSQQNSRFRILVVGKRLSGKSSLIDTIFKVNMPRTPRTVDINAGYTPSENFHLVVHEISSFESGVVQTIPTVRNFVMSRTLADCPASERLHAVWICVPTSDVIDRTLGDGVEEILGLNKVVPIVIVATKFDLAISQALIDIPGGNLQRYEEARTTAYKRYERSCRSLFHRNRDVPVEIVSTKSRCGDLITKLITTTHKRITADPHNVAVVPLPPGIRQIAPVSLVYSIAQRVSHDLIIQASIDVGCSRYWCSLWSSQDFTDKIFGDCVDIVHTDIVEVWSLHDDVGYLLSKAFKTKMHGLVNDLIEPHIGSPSGSNGIPEGWASTSKARSTRDPYQNSIENIRFMIGYIVDLTVILYGFFVSAHDVSASKVHKAVDYHLQSRLREQIHQDIRGFVTEQALFTYRGKDLVIEKIIDLIRQSCVPRQNT